MTILETLSYRHQMRPAAKRTTLEVIFHYKFRSKKILPIFTTMPPRHKKKSNAAATPSTAEEFFFQGGQDEERGERWLSGNDLSKGLRFYASALENYNQCVQRSAATSSDRFDASYNIVRLKFDVWYEVYESGDYLLSGHMTQAGGHTVGLDSLLANIFVSGTKEGAHEEVLAGYKGLVAQLPSDNRTWDVLHGYGLVLTTHIEEYGGGDRDVEEALGVFESVYRAQLDEYNEFKRLLEEFENGGAAGDDPESQTPKATASTDPQNVPKYANAEESVNLADLVETLTCVVKLASLTTRNSGIRDDVDHHAQKATSNILQTFQEMVQVITKEGFSADIAKTTDGLQSTLMDAAQTIGMWIASRLQPTELEAFWKGENTAAMQQIDPLLPEFLSHASGAQWTNAGVQSILDVIEEGQYDDIEQWALLGAANRLLQQQVKSVTPSTQSPVGLDVLTSYSKLPKFQLGLEIGQMYISLADIDVMRARLSTESAHKFGSTLLKNASTYYTSAENTLSMGTIGIKTAGGVVRKQRRLKSEATVKKLMLEGSEASVAKAKRVPGWEIILDQ